jgi:hypothetical protein
MYDPGEPSASTQALWNTIAKTYPIIARIIEENYYKPRDLNDTALTPLAKDAGQLCRSDFYPYKINGHSRRGRKNAGQLRTRRSWAHGLTRPRQVQRNGLFWALYCWPVSESSATGRLIAATNHE